jgi:hypothetical protein
MSQEEIVISEEIIRKEMIREWCGKISKEDVKKIKKETPINLHDNLKNSKMIEKVQKRIEVLLEKRTTPGIIFDLDSEDDFNSGDDAKS